MKFIGKIIGIGICLMSVVISVNAGVTNPISMNINGDRVSLDNDVYIKKGVTMVPVRVISEVLGVDVKYEELTKRILIDKGDTSIELEINSSEALVNKEKVQLSVVPTIKNNITMVPLRFVSETLDIDIRYDNQDKIIYLSTLQYNVPQDIANGYILAIDSVYQKDIALNEDIKYMAIDTTKMRYLSEEAKQTLLKNMEQYGYIIIEATYQELEMQGLIKNGFFTNGILFNINDMSSENEQLILSVKKWRSTLGSIGYLKMVVEKIDKDWKIISTGMLVES